MTFPVPLKTLMPWKRFSTATVPVASRPTYEPVTELFEPLISIPEPPPVNAFTTRSLTWLLSEASTIPLQLHRLPFTTIEGPSGFVAPCVDPSIVVPPAVRDGSDVFGWIVQTPATQPLSAAGIAKTIVLPGFAFAAPIASRKEPGPPSLVFVTAIVALLNADAGRSRAMAANTINPVALPTCIPKGDVRRISSRPFGWMDRLERHGPASVHEHAPNQSNLNPILGC